MASSFRGFKFFENETVKSTIDSLEITAAACGRNHLYFGDAEGRISVFERSSLTQLYDLDAYGAVVTHMKLLRSGHTLITIGDENRDDIGVLKIWDIDHRGKKVASHRLFDKANAAPSERIPLRINYNPDVKLNFVGNTSREGTSQEEAQAVASSLSSDSLFTCIVCFDVSEDTKQLVVALANNEILVGRDFDRDRASPKFRRIRSRCAGDSRLTFVGFPRIKSSHERAAAHQQSTGFFGSSVAVLLSPLVFAVYEDVTVAIHLPGKFTDNHEERRFAPSIGAAYECSAINDEGELHIADGTNLARCNAEAVMALRRASGGGDREGPQDVGWRNIDVLDCQIQPDLLPEGQKRRIGFHKSYLLVASRPEPDRKPDLFQLSILDINSRIKAVHGKQATQLNIAWILSDVSDVVVVAQDPKVDHVQHKLTKYTEVSTQQKLEQLFRKDMYDDALQIAKRQSTVAYGGGGGGVGDAASAATAAQQMAANDDEQLQTEIRRKYGDHLYEKGKFEEAIKQYISAIKRTEPSYVIRKFLDAQRIGDLTLYLEHLHRTENGQLANKNHTTLLLNCYAKLKDEEKLKKFIERKDISFDERNAISVCRQAGYYEAATVLAKKNHPSDYVNILLENMRAHKQAVQFIRTLPMESAQSILMDHGKSLLQAEPHETTTVLISLCTNWVPEGSSSSARGAKARDVDQHRASAHKFIPAFVDSPLWLLKFLESVVEMNFVATSPQGGMGLGAAAQNTDDNIIFNTLIELYLTPEVPERVTYSMNKTSGGSVTYATDSATASPARGAISVDHAIGSLPERRRKALRILREHEQRYCPYHVLVLAHQYDFEEGILQMLKQLKLHSEIFSYYAQRFESATTREDAEKAKTQLLATCEHTSENRSAGNDEASRELWVSLLALLVRSKFDVSEDITTLLKRVEHDNLLPPVAVVEILSSNKKLQLRAVREYIMNMIQRDQNQMDEYRKEINDLEAKTKKTKEDILELQTTAQVFQSSRCHRCQATLDLPAVHFLCSHSYHQRCLNDARECNTCGPNHRKVVQRQREYDEMADDHEAFFKRLSATPASKDGFAVVAEAFGQGIFSSGPLKARRGADAALGIAEDDEADDNDDDLFYGAANDDDAEDLETW